MNPSILEPGSPLPEMERGSRARRGCVASLPLTRIATSKAPILKDVKEESLMKKIVLSSYLDITEITRISSKQHVLRVISLCFYHFCCDFCGELWRTFLEIMGS
jgi:hypothetical protein